MARKQVLANRRALNRTLAAMRASGRLDEMDAAVVVAAQALADAVDTNPRSPGLWKEYREALATLATVGKDAPPDGLDELLDRIGRTPLGDAPPA